MHYQIKFPAIESHQLEQDEVFFHVRDGAEEVKLRFYDYREIYNRPQLCEQLFYERLKCISPDKVGAILRQTLQGTAENWSELRILDLGAGNGIMGEVLKA